VEALTIVLSVSSVSGWRSGLLGALGFTIHRPSPEGDTAVRSQGDGTREICAAFFTPYELSLIKQRKMMEFSDNR
jgi:hypothetical protein